MPGKCWCHTLYGKLPARVYLETIDANELTEEEVQDKKGDAVAMGDLVSIFIFRFVWRAAGDLEIPIVTEWFSTLLHLRWG